jgi:hypothetical protein
MLGDAVGIVGDGLVSDVLRGLFGRLQVHITVR